MTVLHVIAHIGYLAWHALLFAWLYITAPCLAAWIGYVVIRDRRRKARADRLASVLTFTPRSPRCSCVGCAGDVFDQDDVRVLVPHVWVKP